MKINYFILLISFFVIDSQVIYSQSSTGDLPILDFSKNYPKKEIRLQDIADTKYIPLETTDDVLLSENAVLSAVSDKYIIIYEPIRGDIFIFNHTGKTLAHFNHKGNSGQEYAWIRGLVFDDKKKEIFVYNQSIQVYSLIGEYKRTLKINTLQNESTVYNFDDEALLIYDNVIIDTGLEHKTKKEPYRLISKKDGSLISVLDIHLSKRYSSRILKKEGKNERGIIMSYPSSIYYGQDFMLADISSDTLCMLTQDKKITPILTRKPSVHTSEPRNIWATFLTTDKFILLGTILLDFNLKSGKIPYYIYDFKTGEINKVTFIDAESFRGKWGPNSSPAIGKNKFAELIQPSLIKKANEKSDPLKALRALKEDDNPVVRIIKFK
ncbi:6-bladed beta-propeller [Massilibacteroides sp.]|uniref:6-bladed beta-propeller n=1 Tax=Massilibacteroides sp. TaxID=2034766 RepID=UPI002601FBED|nr:6-bladed beta-propeller [Massilibacteroides sp.]MDD4514269.1 6-bladed beta-propeller [Massilibacteroides sp.]